MNCEIIRDLLPMYADGQVSEASRRAIEDHAADALPAKNC